MLIGIYFSHYYLVLIIWRTNIEDKQRYFAFVYITVSKMFLFSLSCGDFDQFQIALSTGVSEFDLVALSANNVPRFLLDRLPKIDKYCLFEDGIDTVVCGLFF